MLDNNMLDTWLYSIGKESVQAFQDDFSGLNGISLCLVYLNGAPATVASNRSLLCFHIEGQNRLRCKAQHQQIIDRMIESGTTIIDTCYVGLACFACPVIRDKEVIGAFFGGMIIGDDADLISGSDVEHYDIARMCESDLDKIISLLNSTLSLLKGVRIANSNTIDETGSELMRDFDLTSREVMVVGQIIQSRSNRDIAETLFISEKTVKTHITNILKKTSTKNRYELAMLCKKYFNA